MELDLFGNSTAILWVRDSEKVENHRVKSLYVYLSSIPVMLNRSILAECHPRSASVSKICYVENAMSLAVLSASPDYGYRRVMIPFLNFPCIMFKCEYPVWVIMMLV